MERCFTVVLVPEADLDFPGYYNASVPALPGCFSYGANREEALRNIKEAILLYLEDSQPNNGPFPEVELEEVLVEV